MSSFGENTAKNYEYTDDQEKPGWKKFLAYIGPGFLVSLAYLDPGNLETDLQAGSNHRYESLAAYLGVTTGKHLAELCKVEYPVFIKYCLWILAELAVIAADIPEVIGTAFALNILFSIPVWTGVLITGLSTLLLLGLQRYGLEAHVARVCGLDTPFPLVHEPFYVPTKNKALRPASANGFTLSACNF